MSLVIKHNFGFFSCCSIKLNLIINYINDKKIDKTLFFVD